MTQSEFSPDAPVIRMENVYFRWSTRESVLLDIPAFELFPRERLLIKGASGSGKTTLLNLIGGVITPQHGSINVLGKTVNTMRGAHRDAFRAAHIGFIFQMFNLIPYLPLVENVTLPCRFSHERRAKALARSPGLDQEARRLLGRLGLDVDRLATRPVTELSVGQQQRVAAARALIGGPELVIADEPTSALDADSRQSFLELLFGEIEALGATLVFVSHDASLEPYFQRTVALGALNRVPYEVNPWPSQHSPAAASPTVASRQS